MEYFTARLKAQKAYKSLYDDLKTRLSDPSSKELLSKVNESPRTRASTKALSHLLVESPDSILADPEKALNMSQILESTDAIKRVLSQTNPKEPQPGKVSVTGRKLGWDPALIDQVLKVDDLAKGATPPEEASQRIADYYTSISDLQVVSGELKGISDEVVKGDTGLWSRIEGKWSTVKRAVESIGGEIFGIVKGAIESVKESLEELKNAASSALGTVAEKLDELAHRFYELIISLIMRMFDFTNAISDQATKKGFTFKEMSLEFPTFDFQFVTVAGFSVPIPKSIMPKLTVTYEGPKLANPKK